MNSVRNEKNIFFSSTLADLDLSDLLDAISIEDSEISTNDTSIPDQNESKAEEPLLPLKMCYEWKEITSEFFEAVTGTPFVWISYELLKYVICLTCLFNRIATGRIGASPKIVRPIRSDVSY